MPNVNCRLCKKAFYAKPSWIKYGNAKYCSTKCQYLGARKGRVVKCFICNKAAYKQLKALKHSKSKKYFCGKTCQTIWRNQFFRGPKHANWKGGAHIEYRKIMLKNKIKPICQLCRTKDERTLCVHHIDKNRKNNKISNLVWVCYNCHHLIHLYNAPIILTYKQ